MGLIAVVVIGIILIGAAAGVYFLVLKKGGGALSEPEKTVHKYFEAISTGDMGSLSSLFTSDTQMTQDQLQIIQTVFGAGTIKFKDVKTKLVSQVGDKAEVKVEDVTVEAMGQSAKMGQTPLGAMGNVQLKMVGGQWLIDRSSAMPLTPTVPTSSNEATAGG